MPCDWPWAVFHNLRGIGAFLISADREDGKTRWVSVQSLSGEPCVLKVPDWTQPPKASGARNFDITSVGPSEYKLDLKPGEQVMLTAAGQSVNPVIAPLPHDPKDLNSYGVKTGPLPPIAAWPERMPGQ